MIGLIDVDSKIPNLALMKISSYYKGLGEKVEFTQSPKECEKVYASAIFTKSKKICDQLLDQYGNKIEIGGTGWDIEKTLPNEIESMKPDYNLYSAEMIYKRIKGIGTKESKMKKAEIIVNAGIGFTSRGCVRNCGFCFVPKKEGCFKQVAEIKDLLNEKSNILILNDNNVSADPNRIDKMHEIRDRGLIVDINQGCDVRLMDEEFAKALSEVKHLRSLHYAWDLMESESKVIEGIKLLKQFVKPYKHMCFVLTGFNTTFEEDMYRIRRLEELEIKPYVMKYNKRKDDIRLNQLAGWVNSRKHTCCSFEEYTPWINAQLDYYQIRLF